MAHHGEHSHHGHANDMPFSEEEIQVLHTQDISAATYVVGLMLVIFCVGVVLYSIVALITMQG